MSDRYLQQLLIIVDRAERGVILPAEAARLRTAIRALYAQASHDSGPSVQECAAADRRWDLEKAGE